MHIIVSWDITGTANQRREHWDDRLREVIKPYPWVRPLTTFFIIRVEGDYQRQIIIDGLRRVSNDSIGLISFIVSPLMSGGMYGGVVDGTLWPHINGISA